MGEAGVDSNATNMMLEMLEGQCHKKEGGKRGKTTDNKLLLLYQNKKRLTILSPFVFTFDLSLILGSEVVLDVEGLSNLLRGLTFDHVRHGFASDIQQGLDIEIIGSL